MITIKQKWKEWKKHAVEPGVNPDGLKEVEEVFYSGFYTALHSFIKLSRKKPEIRSKNIEALMEESVRYFEELIKRKHDKFPKVVKPN